MSELILKISIWAVPIILAVVCHELAHGWVANRLGDPTAARMGRLTLNPLRHMDPMGTVVVPLALIVMQSPFIFGWAKPVPVNFLNLRNPKRDMVKVALAGPLTNLVLAVICALVVHSLVGLTFESDSLASSIAMVVLRPIVFMAKAGVLINIVLAVFNMLPVLPLDGGRVLVGLLPRQQAIAFSKLERYGLIIVALLLFSGALGQVLGPAVGFFWKILGM